MREAAFLVGRSSGDPFRRDASVRRLAQPRAPAAGINARMHVAQELNAGAGSFDTRHVDVVVAPTLVHLSVVAANIDPKYGVSAQNVWLRGPGAFTGETPAEILADLGVKWTITGHSERRALCGETSEVVGLKTQRALECGLSVIPCIGETLEQRNAGELFRVLEAQVTALTDHVKDWSRVVVAYEPVWAIGTGVVATPAQAQEVHAFLRKCVLRACLHAHARQRVGLQAVSGMLPLLLLLLLLLCVCVCVCVCARADGSSLNTQHRLAARLMGAYMSTPARTSPCKHHLQPPSAPTRSMRAGSLPPSWALTWPASCASSTAGQ